ncbi:G-coupled receptor 98, putative [Babesia caballi]|uniref:G-coupled receptor 98, putative n=1 Tax=Babesia caballi TaxID=5871 RepID=A0AAV4LW71_BABCB|nr:G-coupled receptor 98, putative [Babesia caballi]
MREKTDGKHPEATFAGKMFNRRAKAPSTTGSAATAKGEPKSVARTAAASTPTETASKTRRMKAESVVVVPVCESEEGASAAVEPTAIVEEASDKHTSRLGGDEASLINCKSIMFYEEGANADTSPSSPNACVVEEPVASNGSFLGTLKTLMDITSITRDDNVQSLSRSTSGNAHSECGDFSIVEPIREASYNLLQTSSRYFRTAAAEDTSTDVNASPVSITESPEAPAQQLEGAGSGRWELPNLSKWL